MQGWAACTGSDTCYYSVGCRAHIYLVCKYNYAVHHSKQIRQLNVQVESLIAFYLQSSVLPALPTCRDLQQLNIEDCSVSRPVAYSLQDNTDTRPLGDFINHNSFPLISPPRVQPISTTHCERRQTCLPHRACTGYYRHTGTQAQAKVPGQGG